MVKHRQPARMNRYANLANHTPRKVRRKAAAKGKLGRAIVWFRELPRKKKILLIAAPILAFLILTPLITYLMLANDM